MTEYKRHVKYPKFKVKVDDGMVVLDGISRQTMEDKGQTIVIYESLVNPDNSDWLFSPDTYMTIQISGEKILRKIYKALTKYYARKNTNADN